jgi:hypothetical protein
MLPASTTKPSSLGLTVTWGGSADAALAKVLVETAAIAIIAKPAPQRRKEDGHDMLGLLLSTRDSTTNGINAVDRVFPYRLRSDAFEQQ